MPTANNWPARWAVVILEKAWAAQESGLLACVRLQENRLSPHQRHRALPQFRRAGNGAPEGRRAIPAASPGLWRW